MTASGPPGYPLVGHIPAFLRDRLGFLSSCSARYGDVVHLRIGRPTFLLNSPDDLRYVLATNADNYAKTPRVVHRRGKRLHGDGLLTLSGDEHLTRRRMMYPSFQHSSIKAFADVVVRSTEEMLDAWRAGAVVDIAEALRRLAQRIVLRATFSGDVEAKLDMMAAATAVRRRYREHWFGSLLPFTEYWPTPINLRYRAAKREIDRFIGGVIARRRSESVHDTDFLSMLMTQARGRDGSGMRDYELRDEALTLSTTGFEAVGEALIWTTYLIARHPEVEPKLLHEMETVLAGNTPGADAVDRLEYIQMVFSESMRLYPPAWLFVRIARAPDTLPTGSRIPAGGKLYLSPWVVQRNPRYFAEADRFDPERFAGDPHGVRKGLAYFPFGRGRRACIGEAFARMEGVLVTACLARRFHLELVPGQHVAPEPRTTLKPKHGILVRLDPR